MQIFYKFILYLIVIYLWLSFIIFAIDHSLHLISHIFIFLSAVILGIPGIDNQSYIGNGWNFIGGYLI